MLQIAKSITIRGRFPSLNEYILKCRRNHYEGNAMLQKSEKKIMGQLPKCRLTPPISIHYTYYETNRRRDKDNVSGFFHKVFQDAIVKNGMLEDDGWNYISGFTDSFRIDKDNPRIEITIYEKENDYA